MATYHSSFDIDVCFYALFDESYDLPTKEKLEEKITALYAQSTFPLNFCEAFETFTMRLCSKHSDFVTLALMSVKSPIFQETHFSLLHDATLQFFVLLAGEIEKPSVKLANDFYENFIQKAMHHILFNKVQPQRVGRLIYLLRHLHSYVQQMFTLKKKEDTKYCSCATYEASGDCMCMEDVA